MSQEAEEPSGRGRPPQQQGVTSEEGAPANAGDGGGGGGGGEHEVLTINVGGERFTTTRYVHTHTGVLGVIGWSVWALGVGRRRWLVGGRWG